MSEQTTEQRRSELEVKEFFIKVLQDENLLEQFMAAMDAKDGAAIVKLAADRGYTFTSESLRRGLSQINNVIAPIAILEQE